MLGLRVALKDAEKWKAYLVLNKLMDKRYYYTKDSEYIYFPILKEFNIIDIHNVKQSESNVLSFVEAEFPKSSVKGTLKDNLQDSLTKEEMDYVKTAHDIIGTIAILEIPKDLEPREKLIAQILLNTNSQIKTVLKKANIHEGVFRTQKMTYIAGIDTKETIYRENNVKLKLDVEKVYFSIRLGNERKRIMKKVKKGEDILVMFSGVAPYPVVLSKNTKAKHITGIEINPDGHLYGMENLRLNKIHNVLLINDDVHHAIPNIYKKIIGLKSSIIPVEMNERLSLKPSIMEIYLFDDSLSKNKYFDLEKNISELKRKGLEVVIHVPFTLKESSYNLDSNDGINLCKEIGELCRKYFISAVIHLGTAKAAKIDEDEMFNKLRGIEKYYDYFYFENLIRLFNSKEEIMRIAKKAKFKNICVDLVHLFTVYNDNDKVMSAIEDIQKEFNTYFHVGDHDQRLHTCEIGKGYLDFNKLLPLVTKGVVEVSSKDEANPVESSNSYAKLNNYPPKKFDRIIMPLPKTADEFLDDALTVSKKGTIIHFYDFLPETQFDEAVQKIGKACEIRKIKHKILEIVKCGQHAPHVFRICVDFEIM